MPSPQQHDTDSASSDDETQYTIAQAFQRIMQWQNRIDANRGVATPPYAVDEWMWFHRNAQFRGGGGSWENRLRQYAICRLEGLTHIEAEATMVAGSPTTTMARTLTSTY